MQYARIKDKSSDMLFPVALRRAEPGAKVEWSFDEGKTWSEASPQVHRAWAS